MCLSVLEFLPIENYQLISIYNDFLLVPILFRVPAPCGQESQDLFLQEEHKSELGILLYSVFPQITMKFYLYHTLFLNNQVKSIRV